MKATSMGLLQRDAQKTMHENGMFQQESYQPVFNHMTAMDLIGTMKEEPAAQHNFCHISSIDLNGTIQPEPTVQTMSHHMPPREAMMHDASSVESCSISENDLHKIQVPHLTKL